MNYMPLIDLDKTSYKFKDVLWFISGALLVAGGVWRFESNMSDLKESQSALRNEIIYKYTIEIMKINNRIDLIEAKKFVERRNFKSDTLSVNQCSVVQNKNTNKGGDKKERHPQVCMIMPRCPELKEEEAYTKKIS